RHPEVAQYRQFLWNHYFGLTSLRLELKQPAESAEAAGQALRLFPASGRHVYTMARQLALCVPLAGTEADRERHAGLALDALRSAGDLGTPRAPVADDAAWSPLRGDARYKAVVAEPAPKAGGRP